MIDNLFKQSFDRARVAPTPAVWDRIEAALAERRRRRKVLWFRWSAAASVALVAGSLALLLGSDGPISGTPNVSLTLAGAPPHRSLPLRIANAQPISDGSSKASAFSSSPGLSEPVFTHASQVVHNLGARSATLPLLQGLEVNLWKPQHQHVIAPLDASTPPQATADPSRKPRKERKDYEFSADEPVRPSQPHRWALGGTYSPELSLTGAAVPGSAIARSSSKAAAVPSAAPVQNNHAASFTSGVRFSYGISENIDLVSGLLYNNRRGVSDQAGVFTTASNTQQAAVVETNHLYQAFEVPVAMKVNLKPHAKLNPYVSSGISGNFFYKYRAAARTESDVVNYKQVNNVVTDRIIPAQLNLTLGTGIQYRIGSQVSMNVEPGLRYGLVTSDYSFTRNHPLNAAINAGVNLHF